MDRKLPKESNENLENVSNLNESKQKEEDVDEIFRGEGPFAKFQVLLQLLAMYLGLTFCWFFVMSVFTGDPAGWKCKSDNSSTFCQKNFNRSFTANDEDFYHRCELRRSEWTYTASRDYSFVTEYDLVCQYTPIAALVSAAYYIGGFIGTLVSGTLADNFGRKPVLFTFGVACVILSIGGSYSKTVWQLFGINIFIGGASVACYFTLFVYVLEFVSPDYRASAVTFMQFSLTFSYMLIDLVSYYERYWRKLKLFVSLPCIISLLLFIIAPESPRWLLSKGKVEEAKTTMGKILKFNGRTDNIPDLKRPANTKEKTYSYIHLFRHMAVVKVVLIIAEIWFTVAVVYYSLLLGAPNLGGDMHLVYLLLLIPDLFACVFSKYFADRIGRKKTVLGGLFVTGILIGSMMFVPRSSSLRYSINLGLVLVGRVFGVTSFIAVYTWTFEIFPTPVRSQGVSLCIMVERFGITLAPFITRVLRRVSRYLPFIIICVLAIISALIGMQLPETNKKPTREKYEDLFEKSASGTNSVVGLDNIASEINETETAA